MSRIGTVVIDGKERGVIEFDEERGTYINTKTGEPATVGDIMDTPECAEARQEWDATTGDPDQYFY